MKKYSGIVALLFAVVAFVLLMATNGVIYKNGSSQINYEGILVLFGCTRSSFFGLIEVTFKSSVTALIVWILGHRMGILGGCFAILPAADDFVGKKKIVNTIKIDRGIQNNECLFLLKLNTCIYKIIPLLPWRNWQTR